MLYISFLKQLNITIFPNSIDKSRIFSEMFIFLINVLRLFYKRIVFILYVKQSISYFNIYIQETAGVWSSLIILWGFNDTSINIQTYDIIFLLRQLIK